MEIRYISYLLVQFLIYSVSAAGPPTSITSSFTYQDYFVIFFVGIVLLVIFVASLRHITHGRVTEKPKSIAITNIGTLFTLLLLAVGSVCVITTLFALLSAVANLMIFDWIASLIVFYIGSLLLGIIVLAVVGAGFILLGIYLLFRLQSDAFDTSIGSPHHMGLLEKMDRDISEPRTPTLTFKVISHDQKQVVPNARVILKQINGIKYYIRSTNLGGEVTFEHIEGHASDYYAYVDGDEKRQKYRVVRTQ